MCIHGSDRLGHQLYSTGLVWNKVEVIVAWSFEHSGNCFKGQSTIVLNGMNVECEVGGEK